MDYNRGKKIRLGLFILIGTIIFVGFFYLIGSSSRLFSKTVTIHTSFPTVSGLRSGDHVRFSGIIIGTIDELRITSDTAVMVDMSVERRMLKFIRKDSKVEIKPEAIIGDKMIVIYSGTSESGHVEEGDFLEPVNSIHFEEVIHQLSGELQKADRIIINLAEVTDKVNTGNGNISRMINDSSLAMKLDKSADNFVDLTYNLKRMSEQLNNPNSNIGTLLYSDNLTTRMESILIRLDSVAVNSEKATLALVKSAEELSLSTKAINNGNGTATMLLYDSTFADTIQMAIGNLNQALIEFEKVAVNMQHKKLFGGKKSAKRD